MSQTDSSQDRVSKNAKHIVLAGLGVILTTVVAYIVFPNPLTENVALATITGVIGFLAGTADKLWGN